MHSYGQVPLGWLFLLLLVGCRATVSPRTWDEAELMLPMDEASPVERATKEREYDGSLSFVFENDTFAGSDNNFTTGWSFTWTSNEVKEFSEDGFWNKYVDFWSFLPVVGEEGTRNYVTFSLGQTFSTATDISDPDPPQDDQPYAGLLAAVTGLHARTPRSLHSWWLLVGILGPASRAEQVQTRVHKIIGSEIPEGWDTQLRNEPILNAYYDWKYRLADWRPSESTTVDVTSSTGAGLGNAWIGAWGSIFGRFGLNVPDNFGPSVPRLGFGGYPINIQPPSRSWQTYAFLGADAQWVGRNIALDGNTWKDSRSVDKEPWVAAASWGLVVQKGHVAVTWAMYTLTDTYETQLENNEFGAIALSVFW